MHKSIPSFYELICEIAESEDFCKMQQIRHHVHSTTYEHSLKVAFLCYRYYCRHKSKVELRELIRGALLHDYYLYDHHSREANGLIGIGHTLTHPKRALANAREAYRDLTRSEQDAIRRHMFPLTLLPPSTRCGWLVCYYDKVAAIGDYFNRTAWKQDPEWQRAVHALEAHRAKV